MPGDSQVLADPLTKLLDESRPGELLFDELPPLLPQPYTTTWIVQQGENRFGQRTGIVWLDKLHPAIRCKSRDDTRDRTCDNRSVASEIVE
jgi:hypothetical protein